MSCGLCCLNSCTQVDGDSDTKDEPVVDVSAIIKKVAWRELEDFPPANLTRWERICSLRKVVVLEIDKAFLHISPTGSLQILPPTALTPGHAGLPKVEKGVTVLFNSSFENKTDSRQTYSFRTERQTRSFIELSLQRGFTVGQNLELDVKMPTGVEGCEVSGKLGGQLQWSFARGKTSRQEEQVTWSVDNNIEVGPNRIGTASLMVNEYQWSSDFSLPCIIRALPHPAPTKHHRTDADRALSILEGKDKDRESCKGRSEREERREGEREREGDEEREGDGERRRVDWRDRREDRDDDDRDRFDEEEEARLRPERGMILKADPPGEPSEQKTSAKKSKPKIPVFVRRKATGALLKVIYVPCAKLCAECPEHFRSDASDAGMVTCDVRGRCHVVCATEQRVRLEECLLAEPAPAGVVVEEVFDNRPVVSYRDRYLR